MWSATNRKWSVTTKSSPWPCKRHHYWSWTASEAEKRMILIKLFLWWSKVCSHLSRFKVWIWAPVKELYFLIWLKMIKVKKKLSLDIMESLRGKEQLIEESRSSLIILKCLIWVNTMIWPIILCITKLQEDRAQRVRLMTSLSPKLCYQRTTKTKRKDPQLPSSSMSWVPAWSSSFIKLKKVFAAEMSFFIQ